MPEQQEAPVTMAVIQRSWIGRYGPDHERAGQLIERSAVCECGAAFQQMQLSATWLETMERRRPRVIALLQDQAPGFWIPAHCPPCERVQLGHQARIDEAQNAPRVASTVPDRRDIA